MKHKVTSTTMPNPFEIDRLSANIFDVKISENINEVTTVRRRRGKTDESVTQYEHDLYNGVVRASDYGEFIAGIIHLKYSTDDEVALINKGIADSANVEYTAYREFVEAVKTQAVKYFENE